MRWIAAIAIVSALTCASASAEAPAVQRWHLQANKQGKVEVRLSLASAQTTELLAEIPNHQDAVASLLMQWEGIVAWTQIEAKLESGKPSTITAVGWFSDVDAVVPGRGHGWTITKEGGGLRIRQVAQGHDASRLLDGFLFALQDSTFALIKQGVPTILLQRAPVTSVTQIVIPPGAPSAPERLTLEDGQARVVLDVKRQTAEAKVLLDAITTLRAEVAAKKRTRAEAVTEAFARLNKSLASFRCAAAAPSKAFRAELAKAQQAWDSSAWKKRFAALRAVTPKEAPPPEEPESATKPLAFEPNETRAQAKPISPGTYATLRLKGEDWYRIETPAKHTLAITARFYPAFGDVDLEVFGDSGKDDKAIRAARGRGRVEHISVDPQGKTLWLRAWNPDRRWKQISTDPMYTLTIAHVPYAKRDKLEPNDPPHPPRTIGIGGHKGLIGDGLDVYRVKPAPAGASKIRRLKVVLRFEKQDDLDLELRDTRGLLLAASRGTGDTEQATTLEPPGGLTIRVLGLGRYTLEVSAVAGPDTDAFEPNDTRATARALTPGRHADLLLNTEDWYRLQLKPQRTLTIVATPARNGGADLDLELYDAKGALLRRSASIGGPETLTLSGQPAGVIYVRAYAAGFTRYGLHVTDAPFRPADRFEPNETRATARPIKLGTHADLRCTGADWYRLPSPPSGKRLRVLVTFDLAREGDLDLELYAGDRRVRAAQGLESQELLEWRGGSSKPLTLRVFPGGARYRLSIEHR